MANTIWCVIIPTLLAIPALTARTATLRGQIADETGAVIPGTRVTLSGSAAAPVRTTTADERGMYPFSGLPPGDYLVQASAAQLTQAQPANVTLKSVARVLNITLKVASLSESQLVQIADTRFPLSATLAAARYNGVMQRQYVVMNPHFYPNVPPAAALAGFESTHGRLESQIKFTF